MQSKISKHIIITGISLLGVALIIIGASAKLQSGYFRSEKDKEKLSKVRTALIALAEGRDNTIDRLTGQKLEAEKRRDEYHSKWKAAEGEVQKAQKFIVAQQLKLVVFTNVVDNFEAQKARDNYELSNAKSERDALKNQIEQSPYEDLGPDLELANAQNAVLSAKLDFTHNIVGDLKGQLEDLKGQLKREEVAKEAVTKQLEDVDHELNEMNELSENQKTNLKAFAAKDRLLRLEKMNLQKTLTVKKERIAGLEQMEVNLQKTLTVKKERIAGLEQMEVNLQKTLTVKKERIAGLETTVKEKEQHWATLESVEDRYQQLRTNDRVEFRQTLIDQGKLPSSPKSGLRQK